MPVAVKALLQIAYSLSVLRVVELSISSCAFISWPSHRAVVLQTTLRVGAHTDDVNAVTYADDTPNIIVTGSDDALVKVEACYCLCRSAWHEVFALFCLCRSAQHDQPFLIRCLSAPVPLTNVLCSQKNVRL